MIYILQTSSVVCLCLLNSGCHDESTQCAISSWFTLFCYDVICNNFWPNLVIQPLAPLCGCTDRSLCYSIKIITSTNQHIYNFVHQNMLYREKIYTCVYCCWCSSQSMYIRVQKYASIYYPIYLTAGSAYRKPV